MIRDLTVLWRETRVCPRCAADGSVAIVPLLTWIRQWRACLSIHRRTA